MVVLISACGGTGKKDSTEPLGGNEAMNEQPANGHLPDDAPASPADATPSSPETGVNDSVVRYYAIDGKPVDQATFESLFGRLEVEEIADSGETVVNPDGSYGGAGETFHARDGDVAYRYEFHTYPRDDGRVGESRLLFREDPP